MVIAGGPVLASAAASSAVATRSIRAATGPPVRLFPCSDVSINPHTLVSERLGGSGLVADVLILVTERAVDVLRADVAAVGLLDSAGTTITVDVVAGESAAGLCGATVPAAGWYLDDVLRGGYSVAADLCSSGLHPSLVGLASIGPCLAVPLWGRLRPYGVLLAGRHRGAPPFPDEAVADLQGLPRT